MVQSKWFESYDAKIKEERKKGHASRMRSLIGIAVIVIVIIILQFIYNPANAPMASAIIGGIGIFTMLFMFLVSGKGKNKDVTKYVRADLEKLLHTPEEAAQFDEEMFAEPLFQMVTDRNGSTLSFTEHYVYSTMLLFGVKTHSIGRLSDFASTNFAAAKDNTSLLPGRVYYVDVLNATGECVYTASLHGKKVMEEFESAMTRFCPGIDLKEHSFLRG